MLKKIRTKHIKRTILLSTSTSFVAWVVVAKGQTHAAYLSYSLSGNSKIFDVGTAIFSA